MFLQLQRRTHEANPKQGSLPCSTISEQSIRSAILEFVKASNSDGLQGLRKFLKEKKFWVAGVRFERTTYGPSSALSRDSQGNCQPGFSGS